MPNEAITLRPTHLFSNISSGLSAAMSAGINRANQETTVVGAFKALIAVLTETHPILAPVIINSPLKAVMVLVCQMNLADWASPAATFLDDVFQYEPNSKLQRARSEDQRKRSNIASTLWRKATAQKTERTDSDRFDAHLKGIENLMTKAEHPYSPSPEQVAQLASILGCCEPDSSEAFEDLEEYQDLGSAEL